MKPYTVTYYLSDEEEERLKAIQSGYNARGGSFNDIKELFNAIMLTKSQEYIEDRLLFAEWQAYLIDSKEYLERIAAETPRASQRTVYNISRQMDG